jgi:hypothetical protein
MAAERPAQRLPGVVQSYIQAVVVDPSGHPVAGAAVDAGALGYAFYLLMHGVDEPRATPDASALTDAYGRARLGPLPPDTYDVVVRAGGYAEEVVRQVILEGNRDKPLRIALRAAPPAYEDLVVMHENDRREATLRAKIITLLGARNIPVRRTATNLSQYSLIVRREQLDEARHLLSQDSELREVLHASDSEIAAFLRASGAGVSPGPR